jgi:hypothetical protein
LVRRTSRWDRDTQIEDAKCLLAASVFGSKRCDSGARNCTTTNSEAHLASDEQLGVARAHAINMILYFGGGYADFLELISAGAMARCCCRCGSFCLGDVRANASCLQFVTPELTKQELITGRTDQLVRHPKSARKTVS